MFGSVVIRFLLPLLFLLVTFWPDFGLAWQCVRVFPDHPYAVSIFAALWTIVFSLLLPLPVKTFRMVSTSLLVVALGVATVMAFVSGVVPEVTAQLTIFYAILLFGIVLGWLMISTRVWRFLHGIVAVDTQHHHSN